MSVSVLPAPALQADVYARALDARDARFDGVFFVGIITTRIYCRPVCPARVSYHDHRRFFRSAAAAERAGFRPCMRCRPELAPGLALIDAVPRLARDAANRIAAGALNGHSVSELARDLGVSERHLRRALEREIGASPLELAQTHRLLLAKRLLADTGLSIARIAYASGFQSLRRFNAAFSAQYRMPPSALRASRRTRGAAAPPLADDAPVRLSLSYRAPFAWDALLTFLRNDAVEGIDLVNGRQYGRTIALEGHSGFILVENGDVGSRAERGKLSPLRAPLRTRRLTQAHSSHVNVSISPSLVPVLMPLLARLRQLFDLDAEPTVIDAHLLQGDIGALVARRPGMRIPGAIDGFDVALRAILRGRTRGRSAPPDTDLAARVAEALGERIETGIASLSRLAPTARRVADAGAARLEALGVPRERANAAIAVARLVVDRKVSLMPGSDAIATRRLLAEIEGIGDEMATGLVMRALSWPDFLPIDDHALQSVTGVSSAKELQGLGGQWRPWRSYAALHLWLEQA